MANPLALVCEIFTPILVLACFTLPWFEKNTANRPFIICAALIELGLGLISTYGLMILDNTYTLWPALGLDYSTHTAFALTFCLPLVKHQHWSWGIVLLLYTWVMETLSYHSWADIFTTSIAWGIFTLVPLLLIFHFYKKRLVV